jgi:hypothetical protein
MNTHATNDGALECESVLVEFADKERIAEAFLRSGAIVRAAVSTSERIALNPSGMAVPTDGMACLTLYFSRGFQSSGKPI